MDTRHTSLRLGAARSLAFAYGASSFSATLFSGKPSGVYVVRVVADQDCYIAINDNPVATTTSAFLPQGAVEYFNVSPGDEVAAYGKTSAGSLSIVEMY